MNRKSDRNTSSQYKGVSYFKQTNKWISYITYNNKRIHLGLFKNELKAAIAYNKKAIELFGEFAYLNKV